MFPVTGSESTRTGSAPRWHDHVGGGDHRERRDHDLVPGADPGGDEREVQRRGPARARNGVRAADGGRERVLEPGDVGAGRGDPAGAHALGDVGGLVSVQERLRHPQRLRGRRLAVGGTWAPELGLGVRDQVPDLLELGLGQRAARSWAAPTGADDALDQGFGSSSRSTASSLSRHARTAVEQRLEAVAPALVDQLEPRVAVAEGGTWRRRGRPGRAASRSSGDRRAMPRRRASWRGSARARRVAKRRVRIAASLRTTVAVELRFARSPGTRRRRAPAPTRPSARSGASRRSPAPGRPRPRARSARPRGNRRIRCRRPRRDRGASMSTEARAVAVSAPEQPPTCHARIG